jgi:hypothetical protein
VKVCSQVAIALALSGLVGCASVKRVTALEQHVSTLRVELTQLTAEQEQLASHLTETATQLEKADALLNDKTSALIADLKDLRSDASDMDVRLRNVEAVINWRGRLKVTVAGDQGWQVIYANSTGRSQMLRIRRTAPASAGTKLRITEIQRLPKLIIPGAAEPGEGPEIVPPEWDLSAVGAERSQRLACGREISATSIKGDASFDVLVLEDPKPVLCK